MIQRPKGTRDLLPDESEPRRRVAETIRETCAAWGYREIKTPTFEQLKLFTEKSGEDIVDELYSFRDKGGRDMALRPEVTASIVRAYLQEMRADPKPIKLYYFTNCFRYEQPQSGRYREFYQFGTEILGGNTPEADAEAIALSHAVMEHLGLEHSLEVGHLGVLRDLAADLGISKEDRDRLLSLVDRGDDEAVEDLLGPDVEDVYGVLNTRGDPENSLEMLRDRLSVFEVEESLAEFEETLRELERHGVSPHVNMGIARGLEYYTGAVFEAYAPGLGAQDQVLGGGSYELASVFDGKELRSTGFAFGFDRVVQALESQGELPEPEAPAIHVAPVSKNVRRYALKVANRLRDAGLRVNLDTTGRGIGSQISGADSRGVPQVIVVGEREMKDETVSLKEMDSGEQVTLKLDDAVETLTT